MTKKDKLGKALPDFEEGIIILARWNYYRVPCGTKTPHKTLHGLLTESMYRRMVRVYCCTFSVSARTKMQVVVVVVSYLVLRIIRRSIYFKVYNKYFTGIYSLIHLTYQTNTHTSGNGDCYILYSSILLQSTRSPHARRCSLCCRYFIRSISYYATWIIIPVYPYVSSRIHVVPPVCIMEYGSAVYPPYRHARSKVYAASCRFFPISYETQPTREPRGGEGERDPRGKQGTVEKFNMNDTTTAAGESKREHKERVARHVPD